MKVRPTRALGGCLALAVLMACDRAAPPPRAPAVSPPVTPAQVPAAQARPLPLVAAERTEPAVLAPPPPTAPPFTGLVERIALPPGVPGLRAVKGDAGDDVWMLAKGGLVLHWDGKRTKAMGTPRCFADDCCARLVDCARHPAPCRAASSATQPHATAVDFEYLSFTKGPPPGGSVVVTAYPNTGGVTGSIVQGSLRAGSWSCSQPPDGPIEPVVVPVRAGLAETLRFEMPGHYAGGPVGPHGILYEGRRLPVPNSVVSGQYAQLAARAPDDLWLWTDQGVWRGNGIAWYPFSTGLATVADLWIDDPRGVWTLGTVALPGEEALQRLDVDAGTWQRFPTPGAWLVRREAGPRFWLLGKDTFYSWDGRALTRVAAPVGIVTGQLDGIDRYDRERAWLAPSGELWVVGADPAAPASGAAFRLTPAQAKP